MRHFRGLLAAILASLVCGTIQDEVADLKAAKIIPEFIESLDLKGIELEIKYGDIRVTAAGGELQLTQTLHTPTVRVKGATGDHLYTLICFDPDAPSPNEPLLREYVQWLIVDAPHDDLTAGTVIQPYAFPTPVEGVHRYIFALFQQPTGTVIHTDLKLSTPVGRTHFDTKKFAAKYHLGNPVQAAYFKAASPILH